MALAALMAQFGSEGLEISVSTMMANCFVQYRFGGRVDLSMIHTVQVSKVSHYENRRIQILEIKAYGAQKAGNETCGGGLYATKWVMEFDHDDLSVTKHFDELSKWTKLQNRILYFSEECPQGITCTVNLFESGKLQVQGKFENFDITEVKQLCSQICRTMVHSVYRGLLPVVVGDEFDVNVALFVLSGDLGVCVDDFVTNRATEFLNSAISPMTCFVRLDPKKNKKTLNFSLALDDHFDINMLLWKTGKIHISVSKINKDVDVGSLVSFLGGVVQQAIQKACERGLFRQVVASKRRTSTRSNTEFKFLTCTGKTCNQFTSKELLTEFEKQEGAILPDPPPGQKWITGAKKKFMFFALRSLKENKHFVPFDDSDIFAVCRTNMKSKNQNAPNICQSNL
jgi:hypothetical protein